MVFFLGNVQSCGSWQPFMDSVYKFQYLTCRLRGEATRTIAGLAQTAENYQVAVDLLHKSYGKQADILNRHYKNLHKLYCSNQNVSFFVREMEVQLRSLETLGHDLNAEDSLLISLEEKLPCHLWQELKKYTRATNSNQLTLTILRQFLAATVEDTLSLEADRTPTFRDRLNRGFMIGAALQMPNHQRYPPQSSSGNYNNGTYRRGPYNRASSSRN